MGLLSFKKRDYKVLKLSIVGMTAIINPNSHIYRDFWRHFAPHFIIS